ncbi:MULTISPECIES: hypothetical protein [unclassified Oleiphilus]|jgi:hypothetical protein|uniref:hypothetical protein n=2 Tax=Oleiphilus TaxID=141450 RepID=UPI0007C2BA45|nr:MULTISPECIES: hypothetical protein [unclassified Oleiphilus]KZY40010.1 hypothetical protein A3732_20735 [Oleiphilus sp. HI0050]KZY74179.1 hypothetical protein A3740_02885 [Oleiphilus sp. HI0068]KZY85046.1 hypothetical protein A3741_15730 [Oleiphilus sp. HI0069]KZY86012.1 hypothetical protein A3743_02865 [Oleiphilus sp. HI0072]KZZ19883.1 hypothetical protein A3749_03400 [Oleiphilus sp. HI0078]KZZ21667.1 hypothetical protein A3752_08375 [Oleiphilus sp. HI0081]
MKSFSRLLLVGLFAFLTACATTDYQTHYGWFMAENSAGELRQFRVYWQSVRYEGWTSDELRPMPVVIEAQCSERKVHLFDSSFGPGRRCSDRQGEGIVFCGRSEVDVNRRGLEIENNSLCATITDRQGSSSILDLEGEVLIHMSCRPKRTQKIRGGKKINIDYLLSSQQPYIVSTKKVKGGDIEQLVPELFNHSSVCDPDA